MDECVTDPLKNFKLSTISFTCFYLKSKPFTKCWVNSRWGNNFVNTSLLTHFSVYAFIKVSSQLSTLTYDQSHVFVVRPSHLE